jgi:hypothetical protein
MKNTKLLNRCYSRYYSDHICRIYLIGLAWLISYISEYVYCYSVRSSTLVGVKYMSVFSKTLTLMASICTEADIRDLITIHL